MRGDGNERQEVKGLESHGKKLGHYPNDLGGSQGSETGSALEKQPCLQCWEGGRDWKRAGARLVLGREVTWESRAIYEDGPLRARRQQAGLWHCQHMGTQG